MGQRRIALALIILVLGLAGCRSTVASGSHGGTTGDQSLVAHLSSPVASPGGSLVIMGSDFGDRPGRLYIVSSDRTPKACRVAKWSDNRIKLNVPWNTSTGLVIGMTSFGRVISAGSVVVLDSPARVARVKVKVPSVPGIAGQPATISVTVRDAAGHSLAGVPVHLADGPRVETTLTDVAGVGRFEHVGYGTLQLVAFSGRTWKTFTFTWNDPPHVRLGLSASATQPRLGTNVTVWARLTDSQGHPVKHAPLTFQVLGPPAVTLSRMRATTDEMGRASVTASATAPAQAVIGAIASDGFSEGSVAISWQETSPPTR